MDKFYDFVLAIFLITIAIVSVVWAWKIGRRHNLHFGEIMQFMFASMVLPIIVPLFMFFDKKRCQYCDEKIEARANVCPYCHSDLE